MGKLVKLFEEKNGQSVRVPDFYYDPDSSIIQFVKRVDGQIVRFSTGIKIPNVRKAKEVANAKLRSKLNNKTGVKQLIGALFEAFLEDSDKDARRGNLDPATLQKRRQAWNQLKGFWKNLRPEEITVEKWSEFLDYFEANFSGQSVFNARKYFGVFARMLNQRIYNGRPVLASVPTFKNPFATKERKARKRKKSRIFTQAEVLALVKNASMDEELLILLMAQMAFRIIEACSLRWENIDIKDGFYHFGEDDNKAGHEGQQAIPEAILSRLRMRSKTKQSDYVFPQRNDSTKHIRPQMIDWADLKTKSKVTWGWSPHTFRHWCLTLLFSDPKNNHPAIMHAYRISYKVALEHYIHVGVEALESLRNAIVIDGVTNA